jgi:hypothetical protein
MVRGRQGKGHAAACFYMASQCFPLFLIRNLLGVNTKKTAVYAVGIWILVHAYTFESFGIMFPKLYKYLWQGKLFLGDSAFCVFFPLF